MNIVIDNVIVNKLADSWKELSANKQDNVDDSDNIIAVKDLVKVEVAKKNRKVENIE